MGTGKMIFGGGLMLAAFSCSSSDSPDAEPFAPTGMTAEECAAADHELAYPDADGDGWTLAQGECFVQVPPGYGNRSFQDDCDDTDPARRRIVYADADLDGDGNPHQPRGCFEDLPSDMALPAGLSLTDTDCDDTNPSIRRGAFESWDDGVDSNCDGREDPLRCDEQRRDCGCELLDLPAVEIDTSCASADLFVVAVKICCGVYYVAVGNRGMAPAAGFEVLAELSGPRAVTATLLPGRISRPVPLAQLLVGPSALIQTSSPECDISNNEVALPYSQCLTP